MQLGEVEKVMMMLPLQSLLASQEIINPAPAQINQLGEIRPEVMRNSLLGRVQLEMGNIYTIISITSFHQIIQKIFLNSNFS